MPNKTPEFKGRQCTGSKNSWKRISLLLHTDLTGTDKLHPLIIGHYRCPQCFKNVHDLPCEHHSNVKASMTDNVLKTWILSLGSWMRAKKCKIPLWQLIGTQYIYKKKSIYSFFPHYLMKETIFARKLLNKKCVLILSIVFFWNISHSKKNWQRHDQNVYWSSYKVTIILVRF